MCATERLGKVLPKILEDEEIKSSDDRLHSLQVDDEKLLEVHKMLVTNKFVPLSKVKYGRDNFVDIYKDLY